MPSESLKGRRIVLVGGSAGIGLATARAAITAGGRLVIAGRTAERLESAKSALGGTIETHQLDATDESAVESFFKRVGAFDHVASFVPGASNKAMSARFGLFLDIDSATFEAVVRNRFWAQCYIARHGAPRIARDGSIVFMSSTQPRKSIPRYAASAAASGAVESLARILALELAPVRVNVVAPGFIHTPGTEDIPAERKRAWAAMVAGQAVKRLGTPEEIASAILFMMANAYMTGAVMTVDGGYTLT
jgi:NAD(P)-dependent dehydrogenase (short-subunit alcohol dehydrogenase family)